MEPFDLELERVRLRTVRAIARSTGGDVHELDATLAELGRQLADVDSSRGLAYVMGLRPDEIELLWAVVAATCDGELVLHLPKLGPRQGRGLSLAQFAMMSAMPAARQRALGRDLLGASPLVRHGLVSPHDPHAITSETAWVASARIVSFLAGEDHVDPVVAQAGGILTAPLAAVTDPGLDGLRARVHELLGAPCAIVLQGRRGVGRKTLAAMATDRPVIAIDLARLPRAGLADVLVALARETLLRNALPLVEVDDPTPEVLRDLVRFIEASPTAVVLTTTGALSLELGRPTFRFDIPLPGPRMRADLWRRELGPAATRVEHGLARAALQFQLGPAGIHDAAAAAHAAAAARGAAVEEADVFEGVRATVEEKLHGLARRHSTHLTWDDVVLPAEIRQQLDMLVARVRDAYQVLEVWGFQRHRLGPGVAALFSGPPGTGKTLLAAVIARSLGLELFRVDLAQITSKWIGETEKQLDRVFDAAETGHAVLLFDEADSLFAKRTEVRGATERYANLEVNFLLQRLETFAGVALLTTNMDGSLDPAFRRRLAVHVRFPHPDTDERAELWRRLMPRAAPVARDVDYVQLARDFPAFAGAQIRNAVTTAAFLAANGRRVIDQALLRRAASDETQAMGRIDTSSR